MSKRGFFTKENAAEYGRKGGRATVAKHGQQHMQRLAARGGQAIIAAYGRDHMVRIGRNGFWATVQKHYHGDAAAFVNALIARGLLAQDPFPHNGAWTRADGHASPRVRTVADRREQAGDEEADLPF